MRKVKVGECYRETTSGYHSICRVHGISGGWGIGAMYSSSLDIREEDANKKLESGEWVSWTDPLRKERK